MGSNPWVVNASPLILLGKTRHLDLLAAQGLVTRTVGSEGDLYAVG